MTQALNQNSILYNIDDIVTDLNNKTDRDLLNLSNTGKIAGSGFSMPSSTKYQNLTLGTSGSIYIAPANGWFYIRKQAYINQVIILGGPLIGFDSSSQFDGDWLSAFVPVKKNDQVMVTYTAGGTLQYFFFIYAQGSESEAS